MERNDLIATLMTCGTVIIIVHLLTETAKVIGWGSLG